MGQQIRKVTKRRRRIEYLKRKKEQSKLNSNAPIRLAVPVAKDAKPAAKEAPAKKTAAKAPAKKTETKAAAAKKAPANLRRQLDDNTETQADQQRFIKQQDEEKQRINQQFDNELSQLQRLWSSQ